MLDLIEIRLRSLISLAAAGLQVMDKIVHRYSNSLDQTGLAATFCRFLFTLDSTRFCLTSNKVIILTIPLLTPCNVGYGRSNINSMI